MMQFLGNIEAKIDSKARVIIPAVLRRPLLAASQSTLILRKDIFQDCLILYPQKTWDHEISQLRAKLSRWDKNQQQLLRQFVVDAERLEIDNSGRILIPRRYLDMVNIQSDVRFIGVDNTIEIWAKDALEQTLLPAEDFGNLLEKLMNEKMED